MLTIRRHFPRPNSIAPFRDAPTGWLADANGRRGALDFRIRAVTRVNRFCGSALTVWSRARDNLAPYAAIEFAQPGDIMVIAADGYTEAAIVGDVLAGMARNKGVAAIVTDGVARDVEGLDAIGIPVFARGLTPNSPWKDGPGEIGTSVTLGGVAVASGDLVVGDQNGVVVVPQARLAAVAAEIENVKKREAAMDAAVEAGATSQDWLKALLASDKVRYID
jgi:4-hydroxy-4-methyl-2-oxoglutarate aldolase